MDTFNSSLPPQNLPYSKKNREWRKRHLDFADSKSFLNYELVRKSVAHKVINRDLMNGILHMKDLQLVLNPQHIESELLYSQERIPHFPIMNSKLNVLRGEESKRLFDYNVIVTNPNAISEMELEKVEMIKARVAQVIQNQGLDDEQMSLQLQMVGEQFTKDYQDIREIRANRLIKHYSKEQDFDLKFNEGIMDAAAYGEEIYQCDIVGGEPVLEKLDPLKVRVLRSGFSNKIEDADMIIIEDYWSPGRIIDTYFDSKDLKESDIKKIEETALSFGGAATDSMDNIDPRVGLLDADILGVDPPGNEGLFWDPIMEGSTISSLAPYDFYGNIKVLRVFWKSRRKIKKVTRIDQDTRQKVSEFYPETYQISEELGETEEFYYVNQAWEGTKIGKDIYLNMRPRPIQYNRLNNPSRCHFGIIGSIYNLYNNKPFSLVDMMKPYNYMYDVFHDRLNKLMARSWGTLMRVDLAKMPRQWDMEKWFYYAKSMGIAVEDSFAEGQYGAALGKVAGAMNTASSGVVAASDVNTMQQYIMYLDYIKKAMSEVVGITPLREGQVSNRETVGGVERATVLSAHITEWIFTIHENLKKRVIEAFIETAKIALQGRNLKFQFISEDNVVRNDYIDGDEFAECDYGIVLDTGNGVQKLNQVMEQLAMQALAANQIKFSHIYKLFSSNSLSEKFKFIEDAERQVEQAQQQQQEQAMQQQQQAQEMQMQMEQARRDHEIALKEMDNQTKIAIAQMQVGQAKDQMETQVFITPSKDLNDQKLKEKEIENKHQIEKEKLAIEREKIAADIQKAFIQGQKRASESIAKNKKLNNNK